MKRIGRLAVAAAIMVMVLLGLGYAWGSSGRATMQSALDDARQRLDMADARALILDARVSLYNMNFGDVEPLAGIVERRLQGAAARGAPGVAHPEDDDRHHQTDEHQPANSLHSDRLYRSRQSSSTT